MLTGWQNHVMNYYLIICFQYKINMQRCPYIHEMKERLLGEQQPLEQVQPSKKPTTPPPAKMDQPQLPVATVVKVSLRFTSLKLGLFWIDSCHNFDTLSRKLCKISFFFGLIVKSRRLWISHLSNPSQDPLNAKAARRRFPRVSYQSLPQKRQVRDCFEIIVLNHPL